MKSASSAASGSGRQQVQRPATDAKDEPRTGASMEIDEGKGGALPSVMEPNTRGRIAEKTFPAKVQTSSSAVAITIQEGIDRYREGSNEDRECRTGRLGQHHRAVCVRSGAQVRKTIKLPRREHRCIAVIVVAIVAAFWCFLPARMGCKSMERDVMGDMYMYRNDTSKLS